MLPHLIFLWKELQSEHEQTKFCSLSDFPIADKTYLQAGDTLSENLYLDSKLKHLF